MTRKAVIDLGTNTFNLLIAEINGESKKILHSSKEGVALGMGGINRNLITPEAEQRAIKALQNFDDICSRFGAHEIIAIGTSALRDADNAHQLVDKLKNILGIKLHIISGEEEARLIYEGVKWSYNFDHPGVIMDIGGGSTEFIWADKNGLTDFLSLNIGVSRIYQDASISLSDPLTSDQLQTIYNWYEQKSNGALQQRYADLLIGASGSFETFYELIHNRPYPSDTRSIRIEFSELMQTLNWIIFSTQEERDESEFIIPIRKKMAPVAAAKTKWVIEKLGIKEVMISPCSLKEGVISSFQGR